ncbi:MAG: hypothetical protein WCR12_01030 [Dysgonamonadaceae bacterium]
MVKLIKYTLLLLSLLIAIPGCSKENIENNSQTKPIIKNEDILVKTLLYMDWSPLSFIMTTSYNEKRNSLISNLEKISASPSVELKSMSDNDLCLASMSYKFLLDYGYKTNELSLMTLKDYYSLIVDLNTVNTGRTQNELESKAIAVNLNIAYEWWFRKNPQTNNLINKLNSIKNSNPIFGLKDNRNITMDVLRIVKADEKFTYLGVSHSMVNDGRFKLYLSGSNDLKSWTYITELGDRAHQGDIEKWGNGYLVANEQDVIQGSNNVQLRFYNSYDDLIINNPSYDKSITRTFAPTAEGTPDIRKIEGNTPSNSYILLGFHYYENIIHDQQAFGIIQNFSEWKAWKDIISNNNIQNMGFKGNIGARTSFRRDGDYILIEAQYIQHDWSSWRILFGNGLFYYQLNPNTNLGSTSFANPGIAQIDQNRFIVTSFMPSQGNMVGETGELLYTIQLQ